MYKYTEFAYTDADVVASTTTTKARTSSSYAYLHNDSIITGAIATKSPETISPSKVFS